MTISAKRMYRGAVANNAAYTTYALASDSDMTQGQHQHDERPITRESCEGKDTSI